VRLRRAVRAAPGPLNADVSHRMRVLAAFYILSIGQPAVAEEPPVPLPTGRYEFRHRFAEHPGIPSIKLIAIIDDDHIELTNADSDKVFPFGLIEEGTLMWHAASQQWIIGYSEQDRNATDVGGCTDGPSVVDLVKLEYWTC
jgi:hypothetical protein